MACDVPGRAYVLFSGWRASKALSLSLAATGGILRLSMSPSGVAFGCGLGKGEMVMALFVGLLTVVNENVKREKEEESLKAETEDG